MENDKNIAQNFTNKCIVYKDFFVIQFTKNKNQNSNLITCITKKSMVN